MSTEVPMTITRRGVTVEIGTAVIEDDGSCSGTFNEKGFMAGFGNGTHIKFKLPLPDYPGTDLPLVDALSVSSDIEVRGDLVPRPGEDADG